MSLWLVDRNQRVKKPGMCAWSACASCAFAVSGSFVGVGGVGHSL